jgi:hypothetical protein
MPLLTDFLSASSIVVLTTLLGLGLALPAEGEPPFSHADWEATLERFVNERGFVDYQALSKDHADLDRYLESLATKGPQTTPALFPSRDHQLAYYLNAYNALVFKGVLDRGPEDDSVWKGGLISGYSFFVKQKFQLDSESTSLKKLEDDTVRAEFGDPRIHAALNCASVSCPRLPRSAFSGDGLESELDQAMKFFISEQRNVRVDKSRQRVLLSKIFEWFEDDFLDWERRQGNKNPTIIDYVNRYRAGGDQLPPDWRTESIPYDKGINAQGL